MKIAILAAFPIHLLPGFENHGPSGHYATWLPQLARNFETLMAPSDEIHWVVMVKGLKAAVEVSHCGQSFHLLPRFKMSLSIATYFWAERREISKLLHQIEPDLVHGWGSEDVYGPAQADWKGASILSMQGILSHYWGITGGNFLERLLAFYEPITIRRSEHVTSESPWGRNLVRRIAPEVGIDLVEYGAANQFFEIVRELDPEPTFLCVGSLCYRKGVDILAKAFADPRLSHCRLKVLGDGPMRGDLEACGDNVELLGRVGPEKVKELLGSCWALIHPTRADTSPNSVKEARVAGIAIITTQHGGQAQYVEDGESGYFFEIEDSETLVEAVLKVAVDSEEAWSLGFNRSEEYRELLSPTKTAVSLMALYRKRISLRVKQIFPS